MVKVGALKKRYVLFRLQGPDTEEQSLKRAIYGEALKFFGESGLSEAALKLVSYDHEKKTGILRCERGYLKKVLGFLALVDSLNGSEARLVSITSSGTIQGLERVLDPTH
jgi:RNase P/RNase MRP subunit POP5